MFATDEVTDFLNHLNPLSTKCCIAVADGWLIDEGDSKWNLYFYCYIYRIKILIYVRLGKARYLLYLQVFLGVS